MVEATYDVRHWYYKEEKSRWEYFRWAGKNPGNASVSIHNPQPFALVAQLRFRLRPIDDRTVTPSRLAVKVLWSRGPAGGGWWKVSLPPIELPAWRYGRPFSAPIAPAVALPASDDPRRLTFSLRELEIDVKGRP